MVGSGLVLTRFTTIRVHSFLGYLSPLEFEKLKFKT
jgi:hypothetical protein